MAASRGSESSCISRRASTSRCQGLTPRELQPVTAARASSANARLTRPIMVSSLAQLLLFGQQLPYLRLIEGSIDRPKAHVRKACHAMAVDQHARWHALHFVEFGELSFRVKAQIEGRVKLMQEFVCSGAVSVQIDGHDLQPLW